MKKLTILGFVALVLTACGGAEAPPLDGEGEPPPPPPQVQADDGLPPMQCPEGSSYQTGQGAQGLEQYCEMNGVMHGPIRKYYANGNRSTEGNYDKGKTDDIWSWWYEDGKKKSKGSYKKGKQTGSWSWWHENGDRAREGDFLNGRKAGQWTSWYDNGRKSEEGLYFNDQKNGQWKYFIDNEDNAISRTETWENGNMSSETNKADPEDGAEK